jgi:hypothetical protein
VQAASQAPHVTPLTRLTRAASHAPPHTCRLTCTVSPCRLTGTAPAQPPQTIPGPAGQGRQASVANTGHDPVRRPTYSPVCSPVYSPTYSLVFSCVYSPNYSPFRRSAAANESKFSSSERRRSTRMRADSRHIPHRHASTFHTAITVYSTPPCRIFHTLIPARPAPPYSPAPSFLIHRPDPHLTRRRPHRQISAGRRHSLLLDETGEWRPDHTSRAACACLHALKASGGLMCRL